LHYPVSNRDGCKPFEKADFTNDPLFDDDNDKRPIALLDHGGCTHVVKTWNAQKFGMKAAVLIEDHDRDFAGLRESEDRRNEDATKGYQLVIPYMKVNFENGLILKDYLSRKEANETVNNRKPIMLKIDLSLTRPDNRVEYELWYSSILDMSKDQLVDLGKY